MDANQKLVQFLEAVNRSTAAEVSRAELEAEQEAEQIILDAEAKCKADSARTLAGAKSKITAKYQKKMSQVGYQGKTAFLSRRQMLLMQLFDELREKLVAFAASEDYLPWLKKMLSERQPEVGAAILLREADMKYQPELEKAAGTGVSFRADQAINIGGLSILSPDGRRCENHTLDEAFASQLRNFYRNHKFGGGDE